ncbi:MAG: ribonuclease R [Sinobacterium sp.]|nr:ribonuclease R [Sinobacterium sp.]
MKKNNDSIIDPHAQREAKKYDNPIASRELILETLEQANIPLNTTKISKLLNISEDQFEALQRRLFAMQREGQLTRTQKGQFAIPDLSKLVEGRISAHRDGFGFLIADKKLHPQHDDIFLNNREMRKVFDGDIALVAITHKGRNGKLEGEIIQVTQRNTEKVVGKLLIDERRTRIIPENPKFQHSITLDENNALQANHEELVVVEITKQPDSYRPPKGIICEILGDATTPGLEIEVALRTYDIPHEWPEDTVNEAAQLDSEPCEEDIKQRIDLRDLPLVTIDGEDARDFDDAVYCEKKKGGGWRLWVAIADVSHYVQVGSALNEEAIRRATSVYFPERVIPMLPEAISNGLCSLKPQVDRLCMVCEMTISAKGALSGYQFYEAVMHSHARLTYTEVGKMLNEKHDPESIVRASYKDLLKPIDELHNLYHCLLKKRSERGAINFETTETRFVFNEQRKIDTIVPVVRNDAHKLIEECMLMANVATAKFLSKYKIPSLYRVHEGPSEKKLTNLRSFLAEKGLSLSGGEEPTPSDYRDTLEQLEGRDDAATIQTMLLRSMSQAVYQTENKGHFGLAYDAYAHFTSPIRRYPDLLVHRGIRSILYSAQPNKNIKRIDSTPSNLAEQYYPYSEETLVNFGEHCSMAERRADDATRDVSAYLKCEYLSHELGKTFHGTINAVTGFGFFVELDDIYVEGLVHVSNLGTEFFHYEQGMQRLIGENSRTTYQLGGRVEVVVSKVELEDRKIHLELLGLTKAKPSNKHKEKRGGAGKPRRGNKNTSVSASPKPTAQDDKKDGVKKRKKKKPSNKHKNKLNRSNTSSTDKKKTTK